jgi:hypothetical protein
MCKFCEPWNKRSKEVEIDDCIRYLPLSLATNITEGHSDWAINNDTELLQQGYTFVIDPGADVSYNKFKCCPYCGRKLTPEQDFKKMMAYLRTSK